MNIERASEWRGLFKALNWVEYLPVEQNKNEEETTKILESIGIAPIDESEFTIICIRIRNWDWYPSRVSTSKWVSKIGVLWFTDKRVLFMGLTDDQKNILASQIWFQDIRASGWEAGNIWLLDKNSEKIEIHVNVKGPGLFDLTIAAFGTDPLVRATAAIQSRRKADDVQEFGYVMSLFLNDLDTIPVKK